MSKADRYSHLIVILNDAKLDAHTRNWMQLRRQVVAALEEAGAGYGLVRYTRTLEEFRTGCARLASELFAECYPQEGIKPIYFA